MIEEPIDDLKDRPAILRPIIRYGLLPIVVVFYVITALHFDYTPDDTYIYLEYAKNLAGGDGFSFNQGSPSNGVTGPLWVLLVAAGAAGGLDPYIVAKTLDLFFASLAVILVYGLGYGILRDRLFALVAVCLVVIDSWMLQWAGTGMETSLGILLMLLVFWYVYRSEYVLASLVCGVLTLVRPEGGLLFLLVQMDYWFLKRDRVAFRRMFVRSALVFLLVLAPWVTYAWVTFGSPIPNTLGAKSIPGFSLASLLFVAGSEAKILLSTQAFGLLLLVLGLVSAVRRMPWQALRLEISPLFWIASLLLFYLAANIQVVSRYLLPATPLIAIYSLWGVKKIGEFWKLERQWVSRLLVGVLVVTFGQNLILYETVVAPRMKGFTDGMNNCIRPLAYWLEEHSDNQSTVLTPDIGLLGYLSGRRLYDTAGLVTPEMKRAFSGTSYEVGMEERRYESVLHPDFIVDRSDQPARLASPNLIPIMTKTFSNIAITRDEPVIYTLYKVVP